MGLTKRRDSYYVEFRVLDNGKTLTLANGVHGARLKRWKVGCTNKEVAKKLEAKIRTDMMLGLMRSEQEKPILFSEWAKTYLSLEEVRGLASYAERTRSINAQLVPFFGSKLLSEITAGDVEDFRAHRSSVKSLKTKKTVSVQTVNHDHIALKHCLNIALRRSLILRNPAALVPVPDPGNERDRVLSEDEWQKLYEAAQPHLKPILLVAYQLGQRFSEIVNLTWDRVDLKRETEFGVQETAADGNPEREEAFGRLEIAKACERDDPRDQPDDRVQGLQPAGVRRDPGAPARQAHARGGAAPRPAQPRRAPPADRP